MLKNRFITLCQNYSKDTELIKRLWDEITTAHTHKKRHYHTLEHLEYIYKELQEIGLTHTLEFTIFYHDIVYNVLANDNEEQSSLVAQRELEALTLPKELTQKVIQLILETQTHRASTEENRRFLDADLAILGADENVYAQYAKNVRKEYGCYSDATYEEGRKKVLQHFLRKKQIYQTQYFYKRYEAKARKNLEWEFTLLKEPMQKQSI